MSTDSTAAEEEFEAPENPLEFLGMQRVTLPDGSFEGHFESGVVLLQNGTVRMPNGMIQPAGPIIDRLILEKQKANALAEAEEKKAALLERKKKAAKKRNKILIIGLVSAIVLGGGYYAYIRYINPPINVTPESVSGAGNVARWSDAVSSYDTDSLNSIVEGSFIAQEYLYAGTNEIRGDFSKVVASTVEYVIPEVVQKNVYGEDVLNEEKQVIVTDDLMHSNSVSLRYIDWDSLTVDSDTARSYVMAQGIEGEDPDFERKLTNAFAQYVVDLDGGTKLDPTLTEEDINAAAEAEEAAKKAQEEENKKAEEEGREPENLLEEDEAPIEEVVRVEGARYAGGLPIKEIPWEVSLEDYNGKVGEEVVEGRRITAQEDQRLDRVLYSSEPFWKAITRFSEAATGEEAGEEWYQWLEMDSVGAITADTTFINETRDEQDKIDEMEDGDKKDEAQEKLDKKLAEYESPLNGTKTVPEEDSEQETTESNTIPSTFPREKERMPEVGNTKFVKPFWSGVWFLQRGIVLEAEHFDGEKADVSPIMPPTGQGQKDDPAGLNTGVDTVQLGVDEGGALVKSPIRVRLLETFTGQEAIDYFQAKDTRNRGFTTVSDVQYIAMKFEVTNLTTEEMVIKDNSALSDDQVNIANRTGKIYGLAREVKLKPGATGVIESWASSPTLDSSYLIWGGDFARQHEVSWFRVLAASEGEVTPQREWKNGDDTSTDEETTVEEEE